MQPELPIPLPAPGAVRLSAQTLARLHAAGCGAAEIEAAQKARTPKLRARLIEFFCEALREDCRNLRAVVATVLLQKKDGVRSSYGVECFVGVARSFAGFDCNNTPRCFYTRAVAIVRPDLRDILDMQGGKQGDELFRVGWKAPESVDWQSIEPLKIGGRHE